ncbi:hypothetical protein HJG60_009235 [Phyllostomus discolor]|uniref:Uncharacterized protein n=1 Tax=Phyllostomus discolor TaxID=89673 RepID=A0A833YQP5_9CHIR|nr:hypothetical protein HJG60_009235 [Phyllostomus discolor]
MQSCIFFKKSYGSYFFSYDPEFIFSLCGGGCGLVRLILFICARRRGRLAETHPDLGESRPVSCPLNAPVFVRRGVSSTLHSMQGCFVRILVWGPWDGERRDADLRAGFTVPARSVSPNRARGRL